MNIDATDVKLLLHFLEGSKEYYTVVDIVKSIYNPKKRMDLTNLVSMINYRLTKWIKQGIFTFKLNDKVRYYRLTKNKVIYGDSSLMIGDYRIESGTAIALQSKDDGYLSVCFFKKDV